MDCNPPGDLSLTYAGARGVAVFGVEFRTISKPKLTIGIVTFRCSVEPISGGFLNKRVCVRVPPHIHYAHCTKYYTHYTHVTTTCIWET